MKNRVIKFRVWDGEKMYTFGNHAYDLIYNDICGWGVAPNVPNYKGPWLAGDSSDKHDASVMMQYTGLKDKHGKEIYEGDILNGFDFGARQLKGGASYMLGKVTFWAGMWALEPLVKYEPNADLYDAFHYCEIVGNEFENPELCQ